MIGPPLRYTKTVAREFAAAVERIDRSLQGTIERLDAFDAELERVANQTRKSVRASAERWPYAQA